MRRKFGYVNSILMRFESIKTRLIAYVVLLILLVSLCFLTFFAYISIQNIQENLIKLGYHFVEDLSRGSKLALGSEDPVFLEPYFSDIFKQEDVVFAGVYNERGKNIAFKKKIEVKRELSSSLINELIDSEKGIKREIQTSEGRKIYAFYAPVYLGGILQFPPAQGEGELGGFVSVGISQSKIQERIKSTLLWGIAITILVICFGIGIAIILAEKFVAPLEKVRTGVKVISKGNLDHRIKVNTGDEIEELAQAFNEMASSLSKSRSSLERSKAALEKKTAKLQEKLEELEKFRKVTVGRELEMVELKKKVEKLKQELEQEKGK